MKGVFERARWKMWAVGIAGAVVLVAGCGGTSVKPLAFAPLARTYVRAFERHDWSSVCRLGPSRAVAGFSGRSGCVARMRRLFGHAQMQYGAAITGSFVGSKKTTAPRPYRLFDVQLNDEPRVLSVLIEPGRRAVFLYDDCVAHIHRAAPIRVGGCPA